MSDQNAMVTGVAAGVPFTALPPAGWHDGQEPAPLIIAGWPNSCSWATRTRS